MRLLRLPLTGPPLLYEVHSQLAEMLRKTRNMSKKGVQTLEIHREFIALW
jgi:hypothetical protein